MLYYRRRLPHWIPEQAILFVTWRLAGSAPPPSPEILTLDNPGRMPYRLHDERLHRSSGPFWLQDARIAAMLKEALKLLAIDRAPKPLLNVNGRRRA